MTSEFGMSSNRRTFLRHTGIGLGSIAAGTLDRDMLAASAKRNQACYRDCHIMCLGQNESSTCFSLELHLNSKRLITSPG